ncbi:hypothetical protein AB0J80_06190 [Actinoplanes sp. NPDC049548]|uniref:hypothetical protein n=1 Tax=Actinoplanes sp. NPDC049548 TaxID=3155152 RepID=UPI003432E373
MRWFRSGPARRQVQHDPGRRQELLLDVRQRFGAHAQGRFAEQADAIIALLQDDDGLAVAAAVLREFADSAHAEVAAEVADLHRRSWRGPAADRRNYRPLWQAAGAHLRWPLFGLPGGLHPYVQVTAAAAAIGMRAGRAVRVTAPEPVLVHLFEILDLTLTGWEFARVHVDTDAAALAERLIAAARDLRAAMGDPPPLPPPVREWMRRNVTIDVHDSVAQRIVGAFNPGKTMRESLLA